MKNFLLTLLVFTISCLSYQISNDNVPRKNCASDKNNKTTLCDLRLRLYSNDKWTYHSYFTIEQYTRYDLQKTEYQIILMLSLNNFANYEMAMFSIDGKSYTLKASKVKHDETFDLREILYFDIGKDFIKTLADSQQISLFMIGKVNRVYRINDEDISSIQEFYDNL